MLAAPPTRMTAWMPIKIPNDLPARATLSAEGVMVMREADAVRQDIRPMRIGLLNLMPNKIKTETQIARLLGSTPLQVELTLVKMTNHVARNTPNEHMISFYRTFEDVRSERFDGFITTGAPVEQMPFEQVTYWDELRRVFDWTQTNVYSSFNICWGAQAAVHHFHGMPKYPLAEKAFGVYRHRNLNPASPYLRGFSDDFSIPVSRWTENRRADLPKDRGLEVLMESDEAGLCLIDDAAHRHRHAGAAVLPACAAARPLRRRERGPRPAGHAAPRLRPAALRHLPRSRPRRRGLHRRLGPQGPEGRRRGEGDQAPHQHPGDLPAA